MTAVRLKAVRETKGKKCDYCDDFAEFKVSDEGLFLYLCKNCCEDFDNAKKRINNEL